MIKAIAFDLARVFIKVKDAELNPTEKILSATFDYKVEGILFWDWAQKETGLSQEELKKISWEVINKIYEIKEPDIFEKLPAFKFATASNHVSMIKDFLKEKNVYDKFYCHVISQDICHMKPSKEFYQVLIDKLNEKPEDILFIDDKEENIGGAKKLGLKTLLYDGQRALSECILEVI